MKSKIKYITISVLIHIGLLLLFFFIIKDNNKESSFIDTNRYKENSISVEFSSLHDFSEEKNKNTTINKEIDFVNKKENFDHDLNNKKNNIDLNIENQEKHQINNLMYKLKTEMDLFEKSFSKGDITIHNFKAVKENNKTKNLINKIEKEVNKLEENIILNHDISKKISSLEDKEKKKYVSNIRDIIYKNWNQNIGNKGWYCRIQVYQDNKGNLININKIDCPYNESFNNSIIEAIKVSTPFPLPDNMKVFDNLLDFYFVLN